jgi:hypothetical protein
MSAPIKATSSELRQYEKNLNNATPRRVDLPALHLQTVERARGRRLTPDEIRSAKFRESRKQFIVWVQIWTEAERNPK